VTSREEIEFTAERLRSQRNSFLRLLPDEFVFDAIEHQIGQHRSGIFHGEPGSEKIAANARTTDTVRLIAMRFISDTRGFEMTNDECKMTKECRSTNDIRHSSFSSLT
jgi:hypothetical protein